MGGDYADHNPVETRTGTGDLCVEKPETSRILYCKPRVQRLRLNEVVLSGGSKSNDSGGAQFPF